MNKNDIKKYVLAQNVVNPSEIQIKFNISYAEALTIINELLDDGYIEYISNVGYRVVGERQGFSAHYIEKCSNKVEDVVRVRKKMWMRDLKKSIDKQCGIESNDEPLGEEHFFDLALELKALMIDSMVLVGGTINEQCYEVLGGNNPFYFGYSRKGHDEYVFTDWSGTTEKINDKVKVASVIQSYAPVQFDGEKIYIEEKNRMRVMSALMKLYAAVEAVRCMQ